MSWRSSATPARSGRPHRTVEQWLTHWIANIAPLAVRYKALVGYRTAVYRHLIPGLGGHRMTRIEPEHFEKLYVTMQEKGLKPATAHQVHWTARTAFGEALKRKHITSNPVALAKPPRVEEEEVEPFDPAETQRIIKAALSRRNGVRFVVALALGCRQGEALGFSGSASIGRTRSCTSRRRSSDRPGGMAATTRIAVARSTTRRRLAGSGASATRARARRLAHRTAPTTRDGVPSATAAAWSRSR